MKRVLLLTTLATAFLAAAKELAYASCAGPNIEIASGTVVRGDDLVVTGTGWGDNCDDTGPPPSDEGDLGGPIEGIDIFIVQDGHEWRVATVSADSRYALSSSIVVPPSLEPGAAAMRARWSGGRERSRDRWFVVSDKPPQEIAVPSTATARRWNGWLGWLTSALVVNSEERGFRHLAVTVTAATCL